MIIIDWSLIECSINKWYIIQLKLVALFDCDIHALTIVDNGWTLQTDMSCHKICDHVGNEMHAMGCKIFMESRSKDSI